MHLNYSSRARERGRTPEFPSYFLKPPSSLSEAGSAVTRPRGCELLAFEGEIALVVGERVRNVPRELAWSCVRALTAANDFGVYDLRYADRGANVRSKGADEFTPIGPRLLDARLVDPAQLRLRTWVNNELVQDATTAELLFGFDLLVADLSRLMTLEPGDVILTGTPAGSSVIEPGDVVEVEVSAVAGPAGGLSTGRLRSVVVEASVDLDPIGAMPRTDAASRADAAGGPTLARVGEEVLEQLRHVSTATVSSQLRRRGLHGTTLDGLRPASAQPRLVGVARTLRFLPLREDLFDARAGGMNAQKLAVEEIGPGEVLVIEARGVAEAGTMGDILALRAERRGAAGIVTDGAVRDSAVIADMRLPVFAAAAHPAVLGRRHIPWERDVAVACAGALVEPGDVILGDADGVVVVPPALAAEVAADAAEQERQERFIAERVAVGESVAGLYPIGPNWRAAYERWCADAENADAADRP
nr:fumarylacetoacetate hydrolase family protein [Frankia sp. QA3]